MVDLGDIGLAYEAYRQGRFPFDLVFSAQLPGPVGAIIEAVRPLCMTPPSPWGEWLYAHQMLGRPEVPGDFAELGVGLGGMALFMGKLASEQGRKLWAADTFAGLPAPDPSVDNDYFRAGDYRPSDGPSHLDGFVARVAQGGLSHVIQPVVGTFAKTLPALDPTPLAFVHIDADLHDSVLDALEATWDRVSPGGVVAIDDWFHPAQGPARAAARFFTRRGLTPICHVVFPYSIAIVKGEQVADAHRFRCHDGQVYLLDWLREDAVFLEAVRGSVASSSDDPWTSAQAARFLELIEAPQPGPGDIYRYWAALEAFWVFCALRTPDADVIEILDGGG